MKFGPNKNEAKFTARAFQKQFLGVTPRSLILLACKDVDAAEDSVGSGIGFIVFTITVAPGALVAVTSSFTQCFAGRFTPHGDRAPHCAILVRDDAGDE